jgi:hypothetical protein
MSGGMPGAERAGCVQGPPSDDGGPEGTARIMDSRATGDCSASSVWRCGQGRMAWASHSYENDIGGPLPSSFWHHAR